MNLPGVRRFFLWLCASLWALAPAQPTLADDAADHVDRLIEQARDRALADDPTWRRLLHFDPRASAPAHSAIVSPRFFLHRQGNQNPALELAATLRAFYAPRQDDHNAHAICRFPARLHWLRTRLLFAEVPLPVVRCDRLHNWARFGQLRSVSVVSVSGYFGNPASVFGHLLIKLNNSPPGDHGDLLDSGVNFGAAIPDDEPLPLYIDCLEKTYCRALSGPALPDALWTHAVAENLSRSRSSVSGIDA